MIYFVQSATTQQIKIGYAKCSKRRMAGLRSANADQLQLLGEMNGELEDESELHEQFSKHRHHGEWFSSLILPHVMAILAKDTVNPRPPKLNVIVSGDSEFRDEPAVRQALDDLHAKDPRRPISWIILGGWDRFIDRFARSWATERGVRICNYEPKWGRFGRGAGSKANQQLVSARFDSKVLLVFLSEQVSSSTRDLIRRAAKARIQTIRKGAVAAGI